MNNEEINVISAEVEGFRLSPQQRRLWSLQKIESSLPYLTRGRVLIDGPLDAKALKEALHEAILRHEILRTTVRHVPGMDFPVQVIHDDPAYEFCQHDLSRLTAHDREVAFDLTQGPLLNASLLTLSPSQHLFHLTLPAFCTDEAGLVALMREIAHSYAALLGDTHEDGDQFQYADISEVLNDLLESEETAAGRAYWLQQDLPELKFPFEDCSNSEQSFAPQSLSITLNPDLVERIEELARVHNVSTATFLQACWHVLLWKLTGQRELTVGTAFSGRVYEGLESVPGLFARYLPISSRQEEHHQIGDVAEQVRQATSEANEQQDYFDWEQFADRQSRGKEQPFFFPFGFEFIEAPASLQISDLRWTFQLQESCTDRFMIKLRCVTTTEQGLRTEFHYDRSRVAVKSVERLARHYHVLLSNILQQPAVRLGELEVLDDEQRQELLVEFNQTTMVFDPPYCIHEAIEKQSARTPDQLAVVFEQQQLTYGELDNRANQLAHRLHRQGVGPEMLVAVLMERSLEMMVGLLGVLKAGAAYLPLDPEQPAERLKKIFQDGQPKLLLTQQHLLPLITAIGAEPLEVICLDGERQTIATERTDRIENGAGPGNLAYVIYTSGSTGQPKGVAVTHEAICNRLLWMQHRFPLSTTDRVLQKTVYSFDASIWELFLPLLSGAVVVLAAPGAHRDSAALAAAIKQEGVTILQMVPSMLAVLVEEPGITECRSLRRVFSGGEALTESLQERFYERVSWAELINTYGPTEASIDASYYPCERGRKRNKVLVGRPINNMQLYVLDKRQQPVPVEVVGELYIGGVGLARGYLRQPGLTAERFVPNAFSSEAGARLYRTGDLGRYLSDGNIEYLGRLDHQVKVRGFRIELGEIEAALLRQPEVRDAIVLARDYNSGEKRLVAYVVTSNHGTGPSSEELQRALRDKLPDYMVPQAFVILDQLPLLPNGKVNRHALPEPEMVQSDKNNYVAPRTPVEDVVAEIWANALQVTQVGIHDNFFDLGGHSLLATQVVSRIRQVFQIELPLRTLFDEPTVYGLSRSIEVARGATPASVQPIETVSRDSELPLSFAQQRLWFLHQLDPGSAAYNLGSAIRLEGELNIEALRQSFDVILSRHEALRTTFTTVNGRPVQVIGPPQPVSLRVIDLQDLPDTEQPVETRRLMDDEVNQPFDLTRGPLLRALLLQLRAEEYVALVTMHHIVSDGWSMGVLVHELSTVYEAFCRGESPELPDLPIQYADFAAWQREWLQGEVLETQLDYWKQHLADAPAVVELPADRPRPLVQTYRGANHYSQLAKNTTSALRELSGREATSLFMTLLAAFQVLVSRYTRQDHIVVGTDVANRNRHEIEGLIGFFANQLVLHTDLSGNPTFRQLLVRVREVTLGAYAHQDLPFEKLVEELKPERDSSRTPLFQLKVVMQNTPLPVMELTGLRLSPEELGEGTAKFDLTLFWEDTSQGLSCTWQYNSDLFAPRTIQRLAAHFEQLLDQIAREPDAQLRALIETLEQRDREERLNEKKKLEAANFQKFKVIKPQAVRVS